MKNYKTTLNSYNHHYIKIDNKFEDQKYFMPVISVEDIGDICFNLDGVSFEFYIEKEKLLNLNTLEKLIKDYKKELNIYEFEDCTIDIYKEKDTIEELRKKVKESKDTKFGISIDCKNFPKKDIIIHFNKVASLINLEEEKPY